MKKIRAEKKEPKTTEIFANNRLSIFLQATGLTIAAIAIFGGIGYSIDKYLDTFPVIFIIGLVIAYPLTQIYIYKKFKGFAQSKLDKKSQNK